MSEQLVQKVQKQAEYYAKSDMRFVSDELLQKIQTYSPKEIDELSFGVISLDDKGIIKVFNTFESTMANVNKNEVIGKNFFIDVAPCTNNQIFYGSFKRGVEERKMDMIFPYTFTYKMKPTPVKIHLYRGPARPTNWVFVKWK
ncbi:PAS domain-containing protein [Leptospira sp. 96542]|nr:PAS domain-containing protein [Leptospira sp. 96542]